MISSLYYINLKRRPDRNEVMQKNLSLAKVPNHLITRFEAIDGPAYASTDSVFLENGIPAWNRRNFKEKPKQAIITYGWNHDLYKAKAACWASHMLIYRIAGQGDPNQWTIVCEDDIRFSYSFRKLVKLAQKTAHQFPSCDIISLCSKKWQKYKLRNRFARWSQAQKDKLLFKGGTDCYMVKNSAASRLLDICDPSGSSTIVPSIDGHLHHQLVECRSMEGRAIQKKYWGWSWGYKFELGEIDSDIYPVPNHRTVLDPSLK